MHFTVIVADERHFTYADAVCDLMAEAAKVRGTGIAKRKPDYIRQKMEEGKAIIALSNERLAGFCYIESWDGQKYVANSGLIVHPDFRNAGLARKIKSAAFRLSKQKFPNASLFGITTSMAVMKINSDLGYRPAAFSELTRDDTFWKGCQSCPNYDILQRTQGSMCLCTGMVCDLSKVSDESQPRATPWEDFKRFLKGRQERLKRNPIRLLKLSKISLL